MILTVDEDFDGVHLDPEELNDVSDNADLPETF